MWDVPSFSMFSLSLECTKLLNEQPLENSSRLLQAMSQDIKSASVPLPHVTSLNLRGLVNTEGSLAEPTRCWGPVLPIAGPKPRNA